MLQLEDTTHSERFADVVSFVGEDASGSFGILANHARFMTCLVVGLARFERAEAEWHYLAAPGGLLYFHDGVLTLATRRYLLSDDYTQIASALQDQLVREEDSLRSIKQSLHRMEEEILKRLSIIGRLRA